MLIYFISSCPIFASFVVENDRQVRHIYGDEPEQEKIQWEICEIIK